MFVLGRVAGGIVVLGVGRAYWTQVLGVVPSFVGS